MNIWARLLVSPTPGLKDAGTLALPVRAVVPPRANGAGNSLHDADKFEVISHHRPEPLSSKLLHSKANCTTQRKLLSQR